ncbi:MAG: PilZ domain-containing protein [Candidatus Omnitrophota bacterium]
MFKDNRRFQRLTLDTEVQFRQFKDYEKKLYYEDKPVDAVATDISEGGMGIQARSLIAVKTYLEIWISLSGLNQEGEVVFYGPMKVLGKVRWVIPWDDNTFRMGISFLDIGEEDRKAITGFIRSHAGVQEKIIHPRDVSSGTVLHDKGKTDEGTLTGKIKEGDCCYAVLPL